MSPESDRNAIRNALHAFGLDDPHGVVEPYGDGLINRSWRVSGGGRRCLLQALNPDVFADPLAVMANIRRVTAHLRDKGRRCLELEPGDDGGDCFQDAQGICWRVYRFIDGISLPLSRLDDDQAAAAAELFGRLIADLADLPGPPLATTIPGFHDTPARLAALDVAVGRDAIGRAAGCHAELDRLAAHRPLGAALAGLGLPERAVHNDTKLDNVLFDPRSGAALCVVDLDTLMPGLAAQDFGDLVRSALSTGFDCGRYEALLAGFLRGAGAQLSARERVTLPLGPGVITLELAARFLTDHLDGDRYFRTVYPGQNLERCRAQLDLLDDLAQRLGAAWTAALAAGQSSAG